MMNPKYLRILEYPKILENLAEYAMFSAGKTLATNLQPTPHYTQAIELQAETTEARHLLAVRPNIGVGGARDLRPLVEQARRSILILPPDLLIIRQTLIVARELRRQITRLEDRYPHLADIAYRLEGNAGLVNRIGQSIDDDGRVRNNASPALARIRGEIDLAHGRLMSKMRRLAASEQVSKYLQEGFVTQRDGRYVLPLKADFKGRVRGIIHGQSASGATLFVEPGSVVELNNRWKELQLEEEREVNRILAALTQAVAERGKFIAAAVQALAELDLIFAKAKYAEALFAAAPTLLNWPDDGSALPRLDLRQARHPLLDPETVVPIDLSLNPDTTMLVITGPNTGGKTVSLKTVGLLALMAQSGLHIPAADGSGLMVFDAIFADIGDEQSLEQSLSTFSAHLNNIVAILQRCTARSLVIFDELGAGTDPIEGAALAHAILSRLLAQQTSTLVATHYAELKAFAYTTPGVANASAAFDLKTLSPTYKLNLGVPGSSNAFAIAQRLGLDKEILQQAQGLLGEDARQTQTMLTQIQGDLESARMERLRVEEELAEAEFYRQKIEDRLDNIEQERQKMLKRARIEAQKEIDKTRAELRRLRKENKKAAAKARSEEAIAAAQKSAGGKVAKPADPLQTTEAQLEKLTSAIEAKETAAQVKKLGLAAQRPLKVGSKVDIPHLNSKGIVTAINKDEIEVQLGHFRTTLKRQKLNPIDTPAAETSVSSDGMSGGIVDSPGMETDLRGLTSEEALHRLDSYLDQAYLAGLPFVRIIHGKGTGVLRKAIRQALRSHPLVSSFAAGTDKEGGEGVTIARFAV